MTQKTAIKCNWFDIFPILQLIKVFFRFSALGNQFDMGFGVLNPQNCSDQLILGVDVLGYFHRKPNN